MMEVISQRSDLKGAADLAAFRRPLWWQCFWSAAWQRHALQTSSTQTHLVIWPVFLLNLISVWEENLISGSCARDWDGLEGQRDTACMEINSKIFCRSSVWVESEDFLWVTDSLSGSEATPFELHLWIKCSTWTVVSELDVVHESLSSFQVVCSLAEQMSSSVLLLARVKSQRASSCYHTEGGERILPPVRPTQITLLTLGLLCVEWLQKKYCCNVCLSVLSASKKYI